jgi:hypothetical protein
MLIAFVAGLFEGLELSLHVTARLSKRVGMARQRNGPFGRRRWQGMLLKPGGCKYCHSYQPLVMIRRSILITVCKR